MVIENFNRLCLEVHIQKQYVISFGRAYRIVDTVAGSILKEKANM